MCRFFLHKIFSVRLSWFSTLLNLPFRHNYNNTIFSWHGIHIPPYSWIHSTAAKIGYQVRNCGNSILSLYPLQGFCFSLGLQGTLFSNSYTRRSLLCTLLFLQPETGGLLSHTGLYHSSKIWKNSVNIHKATSKSSFTFYLMWIIKFLPWVGCGFANKDGHNYSAITIHIYFQYLFLGINFK